MAAKVWGGLDIIRRTIRDSEEEVGDDKGLDDEGDGHGNSDNNAPAPKMNATKPGARGAS